MSKYISQYNLANSPQDNDYLLLQRGSTYYKLLKQDLYTGISSYVGSSLTLGSIDTLSDVVITTATSGNFLKYNGTNWVNTSTIGTLDDISNVDLTGAVTGALLKYNGTNWIDTAVADYFTNGGETAGAARTLGNNDAFSIGFETNNTERMRILSTGEVGIGTTTNTEIDDAQFYIKTSKAIVQQLQTTNQFQELYYSSNSSTSVKTLAATEIVGLYDNTNGSEWGYWGVGIINAGNESGDYINGVGNQNIAVTRQYSTTGSGVINHACVVVSDGQWQGNPTGVLTVFGNDTTDTTLPLISVASNSNIPEGFELFVLYADNRLEMDASIKTQQPTANGAHPWKLGKVRAGAVTLDASNYVEVDINGTTVKLLKAS